MSDLIENLLNIDPLDAAEQLTGSSYKDDAGTAALGMLMMFERNDRLTQALTAADDTLLINDVDRYLRIIHEMGFELGLKMPFTAKSLYDDADTINETFYVFARRDGFLLAFDTYDTTRVNSAHLYYCLATDDDTWHTCVSSGGGMSIGDDKYVWCGHHNARHALRHTVEKLKTQATVLPIWPEHNKAWLWLLTYADTREDGYDSKAINAERLEMLPSWIRQMINQ